MSEIKYIKLKAADGTPCVIPSAARYLTISLPQLSEPYRNETLHLQVNYTLANGDSGQLDTGLRDADRALVSAFDGSMWNTMPEGGFSQTKDNPRVMVDLGTADSDHYITYTWYYVHQGILIHVTPAASTKLTATAGIPKHSELQDREEADQHPIKAITGLEDVLNRDYQEVRIKTDAEMQNIPVAPGKIITFVGYSDGTATSSVVMRYKTTQGIFGTLTPAITGSLEDDNLIIDDSSTQIENTTQTDVVGDTLVVEGTDAAVIDDYVDLGDHAVVQGVELTIE